MNFRTLSLAALVVMMAGTLVLSGCKKADTEGAAPETTPAAEAPATPTAEDAAKQADTSKAVSQDAAKQADSAKTEAEDSAKKAEDSAKKAEAAKQ